MTAGLGLTALISYFVASNPALLQALVGNMMGFFLLVIGEFALVFYLTARLDRMSQASAIGAFLAYSALNGIMLSTNIHRVYRGCHLQEFPYRGAHVCRDESVCHDNKTGSQQNWFLSCHGNVGLDRNDGTQHVPRLKRS